MAVQIVRQIEVAAAPADSAEDSRIGWYLDAGYIPREFHDQKTEGVPMPHVSLDEAQANLPELLRALAPGDELTITENGQPLARVTPEHKASPQRRQAGLLKGTVLHMAPDFDEPLDEFKNYMP